MKLEICSWVLVGDNQLINTITHIISENSMGEERVGFFSDNKLVECWFDRKNSPSLIGQIHLAIVTQVLKHLNRVFFRLENNQIVSSRHTNNFPKIGSLEIITIIADQKGLKPPHAIKGAQIKGKYCFLTPHIKTLGISKKIKEKDIRANIKKLADKSGFLSIGGVIRNSAKYISPQELIDDFNNIVSLWKNVHPKLNLNYPKLIFKGHDLKTQAHLSCPNGKLLDDKFGYEFKNRDGFNQLINAYSSKNFAVTNGGTISFEKTKALIAIDVDSGDRNLSVGGLNKLSEESLSLSLDLIRLRNISGLIAIDLPRLNKIEMKRRQIQAEIWAQSMFHPVNVFGITKGGVFEIISSKERLSLDDLNGGISSLCAYEGMRELGKGNLNSSKLIVSKKTNEYIEKYLFNEWNLLKSKNPILNIEIDINLPDDTYQLYKK